MTMTSMMTVTSPTGNHCRKLLFLDQDMVTAADNIVNLKESKDAGAALKELAGELVGIKECILEYAQGVTDTTLKSLEECTCLTSLNLNACQDYTDDGLVTLSKTCTSLVSLGLYWNVHIGDKGIGAMAAANSNLTVLNLSGCKGLTDAGASKVAESAPLLTNLDLTRCCLLTNPGLVSLAKCCPEIRDLRFYACGAIGNEGVSSIISNLHKMQVLDLCGSKEITDMGTKAFEEGGMPILQRLNLGWCVKLGDGTLDAVGKGCPSLEYLYLLGNTNMTTEGLKSVSVGCTSLYGLDICGLSKVTDRKLPAMLELFPHLTLLAKLGQAPYYDDEPGAPQ